MGAHYDRGSLLYDHRQYQHAIKEFREELATQPDDGVTHAMIGLALCALDKMDEALRSTRQGVTLSPTRSFPHYANAFVLFHANKIEEAEKFIKEAISLDSRLPQYFSLLSEIDLSRERWQLAADEAARGLAVNPEHIGCLNAYARALVRLNRHKAAAEALEVALRVNPESALSHTNMGWVKINDGDPANAFAHYKEALRIEPNSDAARRGVVLALKRRNFFLAPVLDASLYMNKLGGTVRLIIFLAIVLSPARYFVFILLILTNLSHQIFNFVISLDEFGRRILRREEILAARALVVWMIVGCAVFVPVFLCAPQKVALPCGLAYLALGIPLVRVWDSFAHGNRVSTVVISLILIVLVDLALSLAVVNEGEVAIGCAALALILSIFFPSKTLAQLRKGL
jgi:tetratricopeptide (TPR) repeat protein